MANFVITHPLSADLRDGTAVAHRNAADSEFMVRLLAGESNLESFARLTAQLYFVYDALEMAMRRHADGPIAGQLYDPHLERTPSIMRDLRHLVGRNWPAQTIPLPATIAYVDRLTGVDEVAICAHHYVRYLGDLAGGQVIANRIARHYGASPEMLSFYDFSIVGPAPRYREAYRDRLDWLPLSAAERRRLVEEAGIAFALNMELYCELAFLD